MKTRIEVLPDGRIFCGYVFTNVGCYSVYTHLEYIRDPELVEVTRAYQDTNSLVFGLRNRAACVLRNNTRPKRGWYLPAVLEGLAVRNLFPAEFNASLLPDEYRNLGYGVTVSRSAVASLPLEGLGEYDYITTSSCVFYDPYYREDGWESSIPRADYAEIGVHSTKIPKYEVEWLSTKILLVSTERVVL